MIFSPSVGYRLPEIWMFRYHPESVEKWIYMASITRFSYSFLAIFDDFSKLNTHSKPNRATGTYNIYHYRQRIKKDMIRRFRIFAEANP